MVLKYLKEQLESGNDKDKAYARIVGGVLKARGKDIYFPPTKTTSFSKEAQPIEVRKFSEETRALLEKRGYTIDTLTGQSIVSLRSAGKEFWSDWHTNHPKFEALASMQSEVAIRADQLFIPRSNNKTMAQQEEMIAEFSQKLSKKIPGMNAIMGGMADYVDLAFAHLDVTGDYLFGRKHGYNYARTSTPTVGMSVANVGAFHSDNGLGVNDWDRGNSDSTIFAAPLVVPA